MTSFILIRHGLTDAVGQRITGRLPGVHLNATGKQQALGLPDRLKNFPIEAICSSPLERAMETAQPVSASLKVPIVALDALSEFDFGDWSGMALSELEKSDAWKTFNVFRSSTRAPGGELLTEVQSRMVTELERLGRQHPGQTLALISHADAIKAALLHYLGMPADHIQRLEISPASVSIVHLHTWGVQVWQINGTSY